MAGINFQATATTPAESGTNGNNISINKCFIFGQITAGNGCSNCGYNINLSNNIIYTGFSYVVSGLKNSVFNSNTVMPSAYGQFGSALNNFTGSVVSNNIFDLRNNTLYTNPITGNSTGTSYSNNICVGYNGLPSGNGNFNNALSTNFFVAPNDPLNNTASDNIFQLSATSPALTVATDGGQAGAFGSGSNAYKLSGLSPYPVITTFTTSGAGNTSTPLSVSVTVRGNN